MVPMSQVEFVPCSQKNAEQITLDESVKFTLSTSYSRILQRGSVWHEAGHLPDGKVFRPVKSVFTLEGRQVHEAYLVISGKTLVGFYLPVKSAFSPFVNPVLLPIGDVP